MRDHCTNCGERSSMMGHYRDGGFICDPKTNGGKGATVPAPPPTTGELKAFQREERFIVVKRKHLTTEKEVALRRFLRHQSIGTVECVVVESDWPEYETVWKMIEARVAPEPTDPAGVSGVAEERGWLIEGTHMTDAFGIHWWSAKHGFTSGIEHALRFARKEDAEAFQREYGIKGTPTEHEWPALTTTPEPTEDWYDKAQDEPMKRHSVRRADLERARAALQTINEREGH